VERCCAGRQSELAVAEDEEPDPGRVVDEDRRGRGRPVAEGGAPLRDGVRGDKFIRGGPFFFFLDVGLYLSGSPGTTTRRLDERRLDSWLSSARSRRW